MGNDVQFIIWKQIGFFTSRLSEIAQISSLLNSLMLVTFFNVFLKRTYAYFFTSEYSDMIKQTCRVSMALTFDDSEKKVFSFNQIKESTCGMIFTLYVDILQTYF